MLPISSGCGQGGRGVASPFSAVLQAALERGGVDLIAEADGKGPGIRLTQPISSFDV